MTNQKGIVVVLIPLILVAIGLISTGVVANIDHEKSQAIKRDEVRSADIKIIKSKLTDYYNQNKKYPVERKENASAAVALQSALGELPNDPLTAKGLTYGYWSGDGLAFTLTYFSEANRHFEIVYSN